VFACVGWKVTLREPIWRVMPHNSEMVFFEELYMFEAFNLEMNGTSKCHNRI